MTAAKTPKTITLADPVEWDGKTITEVVVRKPKLKDVREMQAALEDLENGLDQGVIVASQLTGVPGEAFEEFDFEDFTRISEACGDFFPQGSASRIGGPSLPKPPTG